MTTWKHDEIAMTALGVLIAARQDGVTDPHAQAHAIAWALTHCDNCDGDPATCACDES